MAGSPPRGAFCRIRMEIALLAIKLALACVVIMRVTAAEEMAEKEMAEATAEEMVEERMAGERMAGERMTRPAGPLSPRSVCHD